MKTMIVTCATGVLLLASGCATFSLNPTTWHMPSMASQPAEPGTPEWWSKHKKKAVMVPGEGYQVEGFAGYYDQEGRPIEMRVAKTVKKGAGEKGLLKDIKVASKVDTLKSQVGLGPDQQVGQQAYTEGEELFRLEKYAEAAKKFKQAIARWPTAPYVQDAMFYEAESYFFADDYPQAIETYDKLLKEHANTPHLDKVVRREFAIAQYWQKQHDAAPHWPVTPNVTDDTRPLFDTLGRALKAYEDIRLNDPTGPLADDAVMATAQSYFLRERYDDADYNFALLRSEFPQSEHQFEAHLLGLQCKLLKYQGPEYDGTPLEEAKKLVKQLRTQFAGDLSEAERTRLTDSEAKLVKMLAEREFNRAQYYDEGKQYGSARFYYSLLAREYPGTPLADQAKARLAELIDQPDHPDTPMEWLVNWFPENAERKAINQVPMLEAPADVQIARPPSNLSDPNAPGLFR